MSATEAPGSRRGPLGYARDRAPARCRFRSPGTFPWGDIPPSSITLRSVPPSGERSVPAHSLHRPPRRPPRIATGPRLPAQQPKDGGSERSFPGGRSSADSRVHRESSDEASDPPPRMRKPAITPRTKARRCCARRTKKRSEPRSEAPTEAAEALTGDIPISSCTLRSVPPWSVPVHGVHRYPSIMVALLRSSLIFAAPTRRSRNSS